MISYGRYTPEEVLELVEGYEELRSVRYKPWIQVRLLDVEYVLRRLPRVYYEAILLCGMAGLTTRTAGVLVGASHTTMRKRYIRGLDRIVTLLNGGSTAYRK